MKHYSKAAVFFALFLAVFLCFSSCAEKPQEPSDEVLSTADLGIIHEPEFGGIYIKMTIEDFNALGFNFGDSVDIVFSNGFTLKDLPYYSGYYVDAGQRLLVGYPGYDYIKAAINYGEDMWDVASVSETDTAKVTLNEKGKYLNVQEARDINYTDKRTDYASDEIFANFREVKVGSLKEKTLYRSASPCDNQHNRAPFVDSLMEGAGVKCILNLSDNEDKIEGYIAADGFDSPYFLSLYKAGNVIPLSMNMNYASDEFRGKVADGFTRMSEQEGPYLVHCTEGKDRTGFMCMLLEAFAGASYEEIVDDYMLTYDNYYKITETSDPVKYNTIKEKNIDTMLLTVVGDANADLGKTDLAAAARNYLSGCGMTDKALDALEAKLVNK